VDHAVAIGSSPRGKRGVTVVPFIDLKKPWIIRVPTILRENRTSSQVDYTLLRAGKLASLDGQSNELHVDLVDCIHQEKPASVGLSVRLYDAYIRQVTEMDQREDNVYIFRRQT
jgi:hypothetical protein